MKKYIVIILAVVALTSCGKEKITTENAQPLLEELLEYPHLITLKKGELSSFYRNSLDIAEAQGLLEVKNHKYPRVRIGSHVDYGNIRYIENYDSLQHFSPKGKSIQSCQEQLNLTTKLCGEFFISAETIAEITNVSQESDDGKITIQYILERHIGLINEELGYRVPKTFKEDTEIHASVTIQRAEEGWMVLEREDTWQKINVDESLRGLASYSSDDFGDWSKLVFIGADEPDIEW